MNKNKITLLGFAIFSTIAGHSKADNPDINNPNSNEFPEGVVDEEISSCFGNKPIDVDIVFTVNKYLYNSVPTPFETSSDECKITTIKEDFGYMSVMSLASRYGGKEFINYGLTELTSITATQSTANPNGARTFLMGKGEDRMLHIHKGPPVLFKFKEKSNGIFCSFHTVPSELNDYIVKESLQDIRYQVPLDFVNSLAKKYEFSCSKPGEDFEFLTSNPHGRWDKNNIMPDSPNQVTVSPIFGNLMLQKPKPNFLTFLSNLIFGMTNEEYFSDEKHTDQEEKNFYIFLSSLIQFDNMRGVNHKIKTYVPFLKYNLKGLDVNPDLEIFLNKESVANNNELLKFFRENPHTFPQVNIGGVRIANFRIDECKTSADELSGSSYGFQGPDMTLDQITNNLKSKDNCVIKQFNMDIPLTSIVTSKQNNKFEKLESQENIKDKPLAEAHLLGNKNKKPSGGSYGR